VADRGREIFEQRIEYPLQPHAGVKDFVFYLVSAGDKYGQGARGFLDRFYKKHLKHTIASLEDLIDTLHAATVTQIREIVIVAHGTALGLIVPIFSPVPAADPYFRYTTPRSLAYLQRDFLDGKFGGFKSKREAVIAKLTVSSLVTIRACRVGSSGDAMYAIYSFFGGRANVYAPRELQFFGSHPITTGMRIESTLGVHQHLVQQHLLPNDDHSSERQDAIAQSLIDPGKFREPFELSSIPMSNADPTEEAAHNALLDTLDAQRASAGLKAKFAAANHPLTRAATMKRVVRGHAWTIEDVITHEGQRFPVKYEAYKEVAFPDSSTVRTEYLRASARLQLKSTADQLPIQLFFAESEDEQWKFELFKLAGFSDSDTAGQTELDAAVAVLNAGGLANTTIDLRTKFDEEEHPLGTAPAVTTVTAGSGGHPRTTWRINDGTTSYLLKLQHPGNSDGEISHVITVHLELPPAEKLAEEFRMMAYLGTDPDCPGPELAAYFDGFTRDELILVIDHLRAKYKPRLSYFIHHAQQAIRRKYDTWQWDFARSDANAPLTQNPYLYLDGIEAQDLRPVAYDFDFNTAWAEVKASHPTQITFTADLFVEENLWDKLKLGGDVSDRSDDTELDIDSPYADLEALRDLERQGKEEYFSEDKESFYDRSEDLAAAECAELEAAIKKLKELQALDLDEEEILRQLEIVPSSGGKSMLDKAKWVWGGVGIGLMGLKLKNLVWMKDGLVVRILEKIPIFAPNSLGTPVLATILLRAWVPISVGWFMWKKFLDEQVAADEAWKANGRRLGMKEWLWQLILLTNRSGPVDDIDIVIRQPGDTLAGQNAWFDERASHGDFTKFVWAPDKVEDGFDQGAAMMEKVEREILDYADDLLADALRDMNLSACHMKVLVDEGLLDLVELRKLIIRKIAQLMRDEL
jgi:hypothetical protein